MKNGGIRTCVLLFLVCNAAGFALPPLQYTNGAPRTVHPHGTTSCLPVHKRQGAPVVSALSRALKSTFSRATAGWLAKTQGVLLLVKSVQSAAGVAVDMASLFSPNALAMRLAVGLCCVFLNKLANNGKARGFLFAQGVLAVSVVSTGGDLAAVFTVFTVGERMLVYTLALHASMTVQQAKALVHRLLRPMRILRKYVFGRKMLSV